MNLEFSAVLLMYSEMSSSLVMLCWYMIRSMEYSLIALLQPSSALSTVKSVTFGTNY